MPKPYSQDLRERVVRAVEAGASCHEAAAAFEVGVSSAIRWVARWRETGSVAAKPMGGKRSPLDAPKDWLVWAGLGGGARGGGPVAGAPKPMGGKRSPLDAHKDWLLALIGAEPDLTLE